MSDAINKGIVAGSGTLADPVRIYNAHGLNALRDGTYTKNNPYVVLENDINLDIPPYNEGQGWEPLPSSLVIGINGKGHCIKGLYINRPDEDDVGLFKSPKIHEFTNVRIIDANVTGRNNVGIVAGSRTISGWTDDVNSCYISGKVKGSNNVAGIIGYTLGAEAAYRGNLIKVKIESLAMGASITNIGAVTSTTSVYNNVIDTDLSGVVGLSDTLLNVTTSVDYTITSAPANNYYLNNALVTKNLGPMINAKDFGISANKLKEITITPRFFTTPSLIAPFRYSEELNKIVTASESNCKFLILADEKYYTIVNNEVVEVTKTSENETNEDVFNETELGFSPYVTYITSKTHISNDVLKAFVADKTSVSLVFVNISPSQNVPTVYGVDSEIMGDTIPFKQITTTDTFGHKPSNYEGLNSVYMVYKDKVSDDSYKLNKVEHKVTDVKETQFSNIQENTVPKLGIDRSEINKYTDEKVSVTYEVYKYFDSNRTLQVNINGQNKTSYLVSKDGGATWLAYIDEKWSIVELTDIYTKGLTPEQMADTAVWDKLDTDYNSQVKIAIGVKNELPNTTTSVENLNIKFVENIGPVVDELYLATNDNYLLIKAQLLDKENDDVLYRILYKQDGMDDYEPLYPSNGTFIKQRNGYILEKSILLSKFQSGDIFIKLDMKDTKDNTFEKVSSVLYYSGKTKVLINDNNSFKVNFSVENDRDNDIQFRILINDKQVSPVEEGTWSEFYKAPHTAQFQWGASKVILNSLNKLTIEARDRNKNIDRKEIAFMGSYKGLLFKDESGNYYSTDTNEILKLLDFGTSIGGVSTEPKRVFLENRTGETISNVKIFFTDPDLEDNVEISLSENLPFDAVNEIVIDTMDPDEVISFYSRIDAGISASTSSRKTFYIYATCEIN